MSALARCRSKKVEFAVFVLDILGRAVQRSGHNETTYCQRGLDVKKRPCCKNSMTGKQLCAFSCTGGTQLEQNQKLRAFSDEPDRIPNWRCVCCALLFAAVALGGAVTIVFLLVITGGHQPPMVTITCGRIEGIFDEYNDVFVYAASFCPTSNISGPGFGVFYMWSVPKWSGVFALSNCKTNLVTNGWSQMDWMWQCWLGTFSVTVTSQLKMTCTPLQLALNKHSVFVCEKDWCRSCASRPCSTRHWPGVWPTPTCRKPHFKYRKYPRKMCTQLLNHKCGIFQHTYVYICIQIYPHIMHTPSLDVKILVFTVHDCTRQNFFFFFFWSEAPAT